MNPESSIYLDPSEPSRPGFRVYRDAGDNERMQIMLGWTTSYGNSGVWLTVAEARALCGALTAQADAYEAQRLERAVAEAAL